MVSIARKSIFSSGLLSLFVVLVLFTALRNLSSVYYVILFFFILIFGLTNLTKFFTFRRQALVFYAFLYFSFFVVIWSFLYQRSLEPLIGIPRLLLMPMIAVMFSRILNTREDFSKVLRIILLCYVVGAFTLIYQFFFGAITWFAEATGRSGLIRYSSILGSLTIFGAIVGYIIILLFSKYNLVQSQNLKVLFALITILAAAISLQKTAILFLIISFGLLFLSNIFFYKKVISLKFIFGTIVFILLLAVTISLNDTIRKYFLSAFTIALGGIPFVDTSNVLNDTLGFWGDFNHRLLGFTLQAIDYYGLTSIFFGVGLKGGAGIMGMDGISPHNALGDLFMMGGPIYLFIFLTLLWRVQIFLFKRRANFFDGTLFLLNLIFMVNLPVTAGTIFQPSLSIIFWVSVAYWMNHEAQRSKSIV
jgi:hypothetical protein